MQPEVEKTRIPPLPAVGSQIYVPTEVFVTHGVDDFMGGLATVKEAGRCEGLDMLGVVVEERPHTTYNWELLARDQEKLRAQFGARIAHPRPDYDPEFNEGIDWRIMERILNEPLPPAADEESP